MFSKILQSTSVDTTSSKRQQKVYGGSATSRSRTATKDLECENRDVYYSVTFSS